MGLDDSTLRCVKMLEFEGFNSEKEEFFMDEYLIDHYAYIIFPYEERGSLLDFIMKMNDLKRYFTEQTAVQLFGQLILNAMELQKLNKMSHLDIKPDNYVFTAAFELVYIDLGHARNCSKTTNNRTGTEQYLAPEVRARQNYNPEKVDVFNMGIVFFIILYQRLPFAMATYNDDNYRLVC